MDDKIYDLAFIYAEKFTEKPEFIKLLALKKQISEQLAAEIVSFKTTEANYLSNLKYEKFRPEVKTYRLKFQQAKQELYAQPLVKEYLNLERYLQRQLDDDIDDLKKSISNKFVLLKKYDF